MSDKFNIVYEGRVVHKINSILFEKRNLTDETLEEMKIKYFEKVVLFDQMRKTDDTSVLKECAEKITQVDFELQRLWGFPQDKNFHDWYYVPKCTCPKLDNADNKGTEFRITNQDCPVHGWN